jgi:plasmid maintenance system antidote protein VapI
MSRRKNPNVADQLRDAVRDCGLSLGRLARAAGVDPGQLSRFLRAERTLTLPVVVKLCAFLGMSLTPPTRKTEAESKQ